MNNKWVIISRNSSTGYKIVYFFFLFLISQAISFKFVLVVFKNIIKYSKLCIEEKNQKLLIFIKSNFLSYYIRKNYNKKYKTLQKFDDFRSLNSVMIKTFLLGKKEDNNEVMNLILSNLRTLWDRINTTIGSLRSYERYKDDVCPLCKSKELGFKSGGFTQPPIRFECYNCGLSSVGDNWSENGYIFLKICDMIYDETHSKSDGHNHSLDLELSMSFNKIMTFWWMHE